MKKAFLAITLSAGLFVSCTTKETVYVPQTTNPVIRTTTTQAQSMEDVYLDFITSEYPQLNTMGDSYLLELGYLICDSIDEGMTLLDFGLMVIEMNLDEYMMGYVGGAAISAFCPWNDWFFQTN